MQTREGAPVDDHLRLLVIASNDVANGPECGGLDGSVGRPVRGTTQGTGAVLRSGGCWWGAKPVFRDGMRARQGDRIWGGQAKDARDQEGWRSASRSVLQRCITGAPT